MLDHGRANIASVYITENHIDCAFGFYLPGSTDPELLPRFEIFEAKRHPVLATASKEENVTNAVKWINQSAPNIRTITVGCFGPFKSLDRKDIPREHYGTIDANTSHPDWEGVNLYRAAQRAFPEESKADPHIFMRVELSALGEMYERIITGLEGEAMGVYDEQQLIQNSVFAFINVGRAINGGIAHQGRTWRGAHHPMMGGIKVARYQVGDKIDLFPGCCTAHGDCVEGLAAIDALEARVETEYELIPSSSQIWDVAAYYIAALCAAVTGIVAPTLIIVGGRVIAENDLRQDTSTPKRMLPRIRGHFQNLITDKQSSRLKPAYAAREKDGYIQTPISRKSAIVGGLLESCRLLDSSLVRK